MPKRTKRRIPFDKLPKSQPKAQQAHFARLGAAFRVRQAEKPPGDL